MSWTTIQLPSANKTNESVVEWDNKIKYFDDQDTIL